LAFAFCECVYRNFLGILVLNSHVDDGGTTKTLCVYNREIIVANNLESRAQEKRDDRGRERQAGRKPEDRSGRQS
jgi:hypothetical protein